MWVLRTGLNVARQEDPKHVRVMHDLLVVSGQGGIAESCTLLLPCLL